MPSLDHEALVELVRGRPELALELLRAAAGIDPPPHGTLDVREGELAEAIPADYHADLLVLLRESGREARPVFGIVVEVQLRRDRRKRYAWPYYAAAVQARWLCPACVVVVTPHSGVARWARRPVGTAPGWPFTPVVVGPDEVPPVTSVEEARALPELAVLSAIAHARSEQAAEIGWCATEGARLSSLDAERVGLYHDLVLASLDERGRQALEALMDLRSYEYKSDFARHYIAKGRQEGRQEGREEGRQEGHQEGRQEGREQGRCSGLARAIRLALEARGLAISERRRRRIEECEDAELLERWLDRAMSAESAHEVFGDEE